MVFLETALESKMNPLVVLGRNGSLGLSGFVNKFNADAELLDDLVRFLVMVYIAQLLMTRLRMTTGQRNLTRFFTFVSRVFSRHP